jgi:hypothetical protein
MLLSLPLFRSLSGPSSDTATLSQHKILEDELALTSIQGERHKLDR